MKNFRIALYIIILSLIILTIGCSTKEVTNPNNEKNTEKNEVIEFIDNNQQENNLTENTISTDKNEINNINTNTSENADSTNKESRAASISTDIEIASQMANFFYNLETVNKYYDDGLIAMAKKAKLDTSKLTSTIDKGIIAYIFNVPVAYAQQFYSNVPQEFSKPLSSQGSIPAPAGACPAGAEPMVSFKTSDNKTVTPQLLKDKNIQTIPTNLIIIDQNDKTSLTSTIQNMVNVGDQRLATPEGWNNLLWDKLKELRIPASSMMDYQLWTASPDIEKEIASLYIQRLQDMGAPSIVLDAFNNSSKSGWFASSTPTSKDSLSSMDIEAKMTGSINGIVKEKRSFSIPGAGKTPVFGTQTGEGTVSFDHPELGLMTFEVDISLDKFDSIGRAIGGDVIAIDKEKEYKVIFQFKTDGSKKGLLYKQGELIGQLDMAVNAEKFENYVDVKTNQSHSLYNIQ